MNSFKHTSCRASKPLEKKYGAFDNVRQVDLINMEKEAK